jgi:hypothetical protein
MIIIIQRYATDAGKLVCFVTAPLYTREKPALAIEQETGRTSEHAWIFWNSEKSLAGTENQSSVTRSSNH